MNRTLCLLVLCLLPLTLENLAQKSPTSGTQRSTAVEPRVEMPLRDAWRFRLGPESATELQDEPDSTWTTVSVPHTRNRAGYYKDAPASHINTAQNVVTTQGVGWYKLVFTPPANILVKTRLTGRYRPPYTKKSPVSGNTLASVFLSRWDGATIEKVPDRLRDKLVIAVGQQVYKAYRDILASDRWQRLNNFGARPQRLLFASTGTKDPKASDVFYIGALAAPNTVNTIPEKTLLAFADHVKLTGTLPRDGGDCEVVLDEFWKAGYDLDQLAADLQSNGAKAFDKSWEELLNAIDSKSKQLKLVS